MLQSTAKNFLEERDYRHSDPRECVINDYAIARGCLKGAGRGTYSETCFKTFE